MTKNQNIKDKAVIIYILLLYIASLLAGGFSLLFVGVLGILVFNFAWFSNILFYISVVLLAKGEFSKASVFSLVAIILSMQSFQAMPKDWAGGHYGLDSIKSGPAVYIWISSFVLTFIYSRYRLKMIKNKR